MKLYRIAILWGAFLWCCVHAYSMRSPDADEAKAVAEALNLYLDVINQCVHKTWRMPRAYATYNARLNKGASLDEAGHLVGAVPFFSVIPKNFKLPEAAYAQARTHAQDIPAAFQAQVTVLFDSLWYLQEQQVMIGHAFWTLTDFNPRKADTATVRQAYTWLAALSKINADYERLSRQFNTLAETIYETYGPAPPTESPWVKSAHAMRQVVDTARAYLGMARAGGFSKTTPLDTTELSGLLHTLATERAANLGQIRDLGSYHGDSAPHLYDKFVRQMHRMMKEYYGYAALEAYSPKVYEDIVNEFNWAVDAYNNFVRVSFHDDMVAPPAYLLKTVSLSGLFRFIPPDVAPTTPKAALPEALQAVSMEGYAYNHTVLLLDVSGSMHAPSKLPLLKDAMRQLVAVMRAQDRLSVVIYSDNASMVLENVSFTDPKALKTLDTLRSKGKTNATQGIQLAYKIATAQFIHDGNNRIILATDGDFNISKDTEKMVKEKSKQGIHLSVFGFGTKIASESQLKKLARDGDGHYVYVKEDNSLTSLLSELQAK